MIEQNGIQYIELSACAWTYNDGSSGFNRASRPGWSLLSTAEKVFLTEYINKKWAERHPDIPGITGFELHVPNEGTLHKKNYIVTPNGVLAGHGEKVINNVNDIETALRTTELKAAMVTPNNHFYSVFRAATSSDSIELERACQRLYESFEVAKKLGGKTIVLWNGGEVYSHPFEISWLQVFDSYIETLRYAADLAIKHDMYIAVEPKPFEPGDEMFPSHSGIALALIQDAYIKGDITEEQFKRITINDEMGHVEMGNVDVGQNYSLLNRLGKIGHAHLNRQHERGKHDTDNEIEMNAGTLGVIDILRNDPTFMSPDIRRFAGFDYHPRHQEIGQQALITQYANLARARSLEELSRKIKKESDYISSLRNTHRYAELRSFFNVLLAEAAVEVEKGILLVGKEGIPTHDLECRVLLTSFN